jgi:hypothetical protein
MCADRCFPSQILLGRKRCWQGDLHATVRDDRQFRVGRRKHHVRRPIAEVVHALFGTRWAGLMSRSADRQRWWGKSRGKRCRSCCELVTDSL